MRTNLIQDWFFSVDGLCSLMGPGAMHRGVAPQAGHLAHPTSVVRSAQEQPMSVQSQTLTTSWGSPPSSRLRCRLQPALEHLPGLHDWDEEGRIFPPARPRCLRALTHWPWMASWQDQSTASTCLHNNKEQPLP